MKEFYIARAADARIRGQGPARRDGNDPLEPGPAGGDHRYGRIGREGRSLLPQGVAVREAGEMRKRGKSKFVVSPNLAEFNRLAKEAGRKIGRRGHSLPGTGAGQDADETHSDLCQPDRSAEAGHRPLLRVGALLAEIHLAPRRKVDLAEIDGMDIPPRKSSAAGLYEEGNHGDFPGRGESLVRDSCWYCPDLTAEFTDISVGFCPAARRMGRSQELEPGDRADG